MIEDGKLVGIVTLGDVVKAQLSELAMEKDALARHDHGALMPFACNGASCTCGRVVFACAEIIIAQEVLDEGWIISGNLSTQSPWDISTLSAAPAALVDKLVIGVAINRDKGPLFSLEERVAMIEAECTLI